MSRATSVIFWKMFDPVKRAWRAIVYAREYAWKSSNFSFVTSSRFWIRMVSFLYRISGSRSVFGTASYSSFRRLTVRSSS